MPTGGEQPEGGEETRDLPASRAVAAPEEQYSATGTPTLSATKLHSVTRTASRDRPASRQAGAPTRRHMRSPIHRRQQGIDGGKLAARQRRQPAEKPMKLPKVPRYSQHMSQWWGAPEDHRLLSQPYPRLGPGRSCRTSMRARWPAPAAARRGRRSAARSAPAASSAALRRRRRTTRRPDDQHDELPQRDTGLPGRVEPSAYAAHVGLMCAIRLASCRQAANSASSIPRQGVRRLLHPRREPAQAPTQRGETPAAVPGTAGRENGASHRPARAAWPRARMPGWRQRPPHNATARPQRPPAMASVRRRDRQA